MNEPRIDFVISNPGHHLAQILPLFAPLRRQAGASSRVLSLCELRGFSTPQEAIVAAGADVLRLVPPGIRRPPERRSGRGTGGGRSWGRRLAWSLLLARPLARALRRRPHLAVLPNDAAFPYDRLVTALGSRSIPFVLLQEGIRFPLPATASGPAYGSGGAVAIAAWGETSAEYFRRQGVPGERIFLTGNPRFDALAAGAAERAPRPEGGRKVLLLVTNPIDDQGFCSTREKLAQFRRFAEGLAPLLEGELELWVRPHGRESAASYARAIDDLPHRRRILMRAEGSLHALLAAADAVVVVGSTAGLEALLFDRPLGVLEIPGAGFVYDYVDGGAALGLGRGEPLAEQVDRLLGTRPVAAGKVESYLARSLATRSNSSDLVTRLIQRCLEQADDPA